MGKDIKIVRGHPFEQEWDINYDIHSEDKIDSSVPFVIKKDGNIVMELNYNYGLGIIQFQNSNSATLIISIYETDMLEDGNYTYEYNAETFNGKDILNISGNLIVSSDKSDTVPEIVRPVRPWDLLRSKKSPEGERVTEKQRQERLSICEECPRFVKLTSQCLECGCIMKLKTKLAAATCPLGKW